MDQLTTWPTSKFPALGNSENEYSYDQVLNTSDEEPSIEVAKRVKAAQEMQAERYEGYNIRLNNGMDGQILIDYAIPVDDGREILNEAAKKFRLSMRAYNRVLRVARTIADLEQSKWVHKVHIAEALSYRQMDFAALEAA